MGLIEAKRDAFCIAGRALPIPLCLARIHF